MAYTSIHTIKATDWAALSYITNGDKTFDGLYVQSYACRADSRGAAEDFRDVRETGTGRIQILAYHIIQSFKPDEVTPVQALQIGEELCDKFLKGDYQYVLAVHTDKEHLHCHVIFNNTNLYNGLSFTTEHNQGKKNERAWAELRQISDEICQKHGISVIDEPEKGQSVSHFERDMQMQGKSWKDKLRGKIAEIAFYSKNFDDFLQRCNECGIEYVYKPQNKVKLKFRLKDEGQQKFTRADTLGEEYTAERIAEQIEQIQQGRAILDRLAEKKKHESVATSIATVTAPIKSNAVEPVPMPEPTEPETNDVWAEIRDMRGSATMIADLEANGITSLDELKSFFWNTHHDDDHTKELDAIEKKINDIEKLIEKSKHCNELYPIYKEHKKLTGLKEKFYKKKHADELDDFHKTYNYISKAVKKYDLPGNADRTLELQCLLLKLKEEYNALVPEHNAFLRKQAAASQYSRQVRNYLDTKKQQERNKQYQERKRSQQKKRNYLE